jgi:acyl-CoA hydrolase
MQVQYCSASEAVALIESNQRVFIHGGAATPCLLLNSLLQRAGQIRNVELVAISTYGFIDWDHPIVRDSFYLNSLFVSANVRDWVNCASGDYVPVFLSEIPGLFEKGILPLDVAIVQVSPPDKHGYCTLGTSVDVAWSAVHSARTIIAQVNPRMPRVLGDGIIHTSRFDAMVLDASELAEVDYSAKRNAVTETIGRNVANLIEDGATLQMGIGAIPDAVLGQLTGHKGLGVHTEMFSDGIIPLVQQGIITNEYKKVQPGKLTTSFVLGTRKVYDFVNDNPLVNCMNVAFVNDTCYQEKSKGGCYQ